jgi:hypothetical protein
VSASVGDHAAARHAAPPSPNRQGERLVYLRQSAKGVGQDNVLLSVPEVIGRQVRINDMSSTIIGVEQRAPQYPQRTDVFVNMVTSPHHLSATMK